MSETQLSHVARVWQANPDMSVSDALFFVLNLVKQHEVH